MTKRPILLAAFLALMTPPVLAQDAAPAPAEAEQTAPAEDPALAAAAEFDTGYRPSPTVSARIQRDFLERIRWSAGLEARDRLAAAFEERSPVDIWLELVASDGLAANNVADALTSYWVLNWVAANGAYAAKIDNASVQRQLRIAFANDPSFSTMGDMQRQQLAEGYVLDFLVEHAALNTAVENRDVAMLNRLAAAAVLRFRQRMNVDLLQVVPGPNGFGIPADPPPPGGPSLAPPAN
ncbi:hypothetical protein SAMN06295905_0506 [Devosia lucknowensis]|uniref:Uncharacterized protein n=1 Tax=Devosia lucknowensis TaxID=1096929 RepID=A0A1Y6EG12_9HYPH|nr:DUF6683 family protein [Devosia lucknowensis]SMQ61329.1 hypothetical protein SAMN06295905_0506 [Devosia lucknowensis]